MNERFQFIEIRGEQPPLKICRAVTDGLAKSPKTLPTHFLYDRAGSEIFEKITELPEYYPTRTERAILEQNAESIISQLEYGFALIEFGSGSSTKTRLLIEAALNRQPNLRYFPIDISFDFLRSSSLELLEEHPCLHVTAIGAEYFDAASALPNDVGPRLILFLGSNIGNLTREEATDFLCRISSQLGPQDRLLIGIDLVKPAELLFAAYNDAAGVTAEFNRNLLRRINRELGANFDENAFLHHAPYDEDENRIQMRLVSQGNQTVTVPEIDRIYEFRDQEFIHTEWSHKYTRESFEALCQPARLQIEHLWTDEKDWFGLAMLSLCGESS